MGLRSDLQDILKALLGSDNVYYQPPSNVQMVYPCIVYKRDNQDVKYADDGVYFKKKRYQVTVIDRDPDSIIPDKISELPLCSYDRFYTADNLNHDVFKLFF